ncbi:integrase [Streptomyces sp. 4R-3d]|uniref:integrase n=1 Tax=Streptomyces sp. 4R-3d TaxID=2559605 RepID=UPI0010728403|nr:integrase [Streptomyces sp. 4R-3d]TFI30082.1 integrase [Streptomyces sp. 4R-3d]
MPYIERRGNKVRVKWWAGEYLDNGKKKYEFQSGFDDDDEAYNFGLDREYEVRHGTHIGRKRGDILMKDYTLPIWLPDQDLRPESVRGYRSTIRAQIDKQWGYRRVGEIDTPEYIAWKNQLNQKVEKGELSRTYVETILMIFGMLMADAVNRYKYRTDVPIPVAEPRRGKYVKKTRKKKRPIRTGVVYQLAVNAYMVWGFTGWVYIWHAAFAGNRPGEMYGLQKMYCPPAWPAADPDRDQRKESQERYGKMPAVRTEFQHQWLNGKPVLTAPKYDSHRSLVLPPFLHEMHCALAASHDSPWMFPAMNGGPLLKAAFERDYWHPIRDGGPERGSRKDFARPPIPAVEEFDGLAIYRLRHWMKECLDEDGHSEVAVETRMGHEIAGVKGLYGNLTPKMEADIVEAQQERWERFHQAAGGLWVPPFPTPLPVDQDVSGSTQVK